MSSIQDPYAEGAPLTSEHRSFIMGERFMGICKDEGLISEEQYSRCAELHIDAKAGSPVYCVLRLYVTVSQAKEIAKAELAADAEEAGTP